MTPRQTRAAIRALRKSEAEQARRAACFDDLLAALQALVALDDGDKPDLWHFNVEFDAARAAITRATGGTP